MKKKIAIILLVTVLLTSCMATLCACVEEGPKPREVELELINPTTGEVIERKDKIDMPPEKTLVEVRIKDKETGEYLTDDDLPGNTVSGSCRVSFNILRNDGHVYRQERYDGYWPTKEDIEAAHKYHYYEVVIVFDCIPQDNSSYRRKYELTSKYIRFSINTDNLWEDVDA